MTKSKRQEKTDSGVVFSTPENPPVLLIWDLTDCWLRVDFVVEFFLKKIGIVLLLGVSCKIKKIPFVQVYQTEPNSLVGAMWAMWGCGMPDTKREGEK